MSKPIYLRPDADVEARVEDLLARMTLEEKVAQLTSVWVMLDPAGGDMAPFQGQLRLPKTDVEGVLAHGIGQVSRALGSRPISPANGVRAVNAFQKRMLESTRLGIPALVHEECLSGLMTEGATQFPSPLNYGATWNPALMRRVGDTIRRQMRRLGAHQGLAPVADVARDARWGRVEECIGEDPYLVGAMVTEYVRGLQGDSLASGVVATLKHFAGYSGGEGGRNFAPVHVGEREMRDVYLVPFEMAIRLGGAKSVMNSYAEIDGDPAAASRWLLTKVLRDDWGFDGYVVADYYAVKFLETLHRVAENTADAAARALSAGLDVELPLPGGYWTGLPEALRTGRLEPDVIDTSVRRVLRYKFRLGLFEQPYVAENPGEVNTAADRELAAEVARQSITLLKNDGTLPLAKDVSRIAVIGPNAADGMSLFGNYSYANHVASHYPDRPLAEAPVSVLAALREAFGPNRVSFAEGCRIQVDPGARSQLEDTGDGLRVKTENISHDRAGIAAAVDAARAARLVVLVLGDKAGHFRVGSVGEGTDTVSLDLPGVQPELAAAVLETGVPVVLVLINGRPFAIPSLVERCAAVVEAWFPGEAGAAAIVDVLTGATNPGGRLTVTYPRATGSMPRFYNHKPLARGIPRAPEFEPLFPFGHGLGYTTFAYRDFAIGSPSIPTDGETLVEVTVENTGARAGDEVVQLYARDLTGQCVRPVAELKGFTRLTLAPGEARRVRFRLHTDLLSFTGLDYRRIVEPGPVRLWVGSSASESDVRGEGLLDLTGPIRVVGRDRRLEVPVESEPAL